MIDLEYSLIIEATDDPNFFGFYSEELEGFTGVGHSIEDCVYKVRYASFDFAVATPALTPVEGLR